MGTLIPHFKQWTDHLDGKPITISAYKTYRTTHPTADCTVFSRECKIFSEIDLMLVHKTSLNRFKKTENISSICSDHHGMKL